MNASTSLQLDSRRMAMLKAMGLEPWWQPPAAAQGPAASASPQPQALLRPDAATAEKAVVRASAPQASGAPSHAVAPARAVAEPPQPTAAQPLATEHWHWSDPAPLDLPLPAAMQAAACDAALPRWWIVADDWQLVPDAADAARQLLLNMLRAMGLPGRAQVWLSLVRPADSAEPPVPAPSAEAEAARLGAHIVLIMGRHASQALLGERAGLATLRQQARQLGPAVVQVTDSPTRLLRAQHSKPQVWQDLKRALRAMHGLAEGN